MKTRIEISSIFFISFFDSGCYFHLSPQNRHWKQQRTVTPLPWREGMEGRGNPIGNVTPSPQPSPVKGEGEEFDINLHFWISSFSYLQFELSMFMVRIKKYAQSVRFFSFV
jgi:hypothetical protein